MIRWETLTNWNTYDSLIIIYQETLEALNELSTFFKENTIRKRRNLRGDIESRSLSINQVTYHIHDSESYSYFCISLDRIFSNHSTWLKNVIWLEILTRAHSLYYLSSLALDSVQHEVASMDKSCKEMSNKLAAVKGRTHHLMSQMSSFQATRQANN